MPGSVGTVSVLAFVMKLRISADFVMADPETNIVMMVIIIAFPKSSATV